MVTGVVASDTDYCGGVKLDLKADIETWIQEIIKPSAAPRQPELEGGENQLQPVKQGAHAEAQCCPALRTLASAGGAAAYDGTGAVSSRSCARASEQTQKVTTPP